jgi:hypothetical protein
LRTLDGGNFARCKVGPVGDPNDGSPYRWHQKNLLRRSAAGNDYEWDREPYYYGHGVVKTGTMMPDPNAVPELHIVALPFGPSTKICGDGQLNRISGLSDKVSSVCVPVRTVAKLFEHPEQMT